MRYGGVVFNDVKSHKWGANANAVIVLDHKFAFLLHPRNV